LLGSLNVYKFGLCILENTVKAVFYNVVFVCRISSEEFGRKFGSTPKEGEVSNSIDVS
jgi:hypothetical protein